MAIAAARLLITDKRSDGYPTSHSWGLDYDFTNVDRAFKLPGPYQNAAREAPEWELDAITAVPEMNAVILSSHAAMEDMDLSGWNQEVSAYWKEVVPPGWRYQWIKYYDARADQSGSLLKSDATFRKNPSWCLFFLRTQPPDDQLDPIFWSLTLNAMGTNQYQLYVPQYGFAEGKDNLCPRLYRSLDVGGTWECVDRLATDQAVRWASSAFGRVERVYCRFIQDHLLLTLGDRDTWIYYEKGLDIGQGHVRVEMGGGQMAFWLQQVSYETEGTIERRIKTHVPAMINQEAEDTVQHLALEPDGTAVASSMETDEEGNVWPKVVLTSSGEQTPVLYEVQATRPAIHAEPVQDVLFDNTLEAHLDRLRAIEFTVAQDWRGSSFVAQLDPGEEYGLSGNEMATVAVKVDDGEYVNQVTGYLETPRLAADPNQPENIFLELRAHDRLVKLRNKRGWYLPSFAGWSFADAFYWLMHERAGVPDACLSIDAGGSEFTYPCPLGDLILKFDHTLDIVAIADQLAAAAGRKWGVDQDGVVFTYALGTQVYGGTPDFVLDSDTEVEADIATIFEFERDILSIRNHVLVLGQDSQGNDRPAIWSCTNSMTDPDWDPFVGDDLWEVQIAPDGGNSAVIAQFTGTELMKYRAMITWETAGKPDLFPDHYVEVSTNSLGITEGTIFRIIEKWGRLDCRSGEFVTRFTGVIEG